MISDTFEGRLRADMEVALERACHSMTNGIALDHEARKFIAAEIIRSASRGKTTLTSLTKVGRQAAHAYRKRFG